MMDEVKYIPVKEFAERAGVSTQAIYKAVRKANGKLSPYVIQDGNRYYIKSNALTEVYGVGIIETNLTTNQPTETNQNQPKATAIQPDGCENVNQKQPNSTNQQPDFTTYLLAEIEELKAEKAGYLDTIQKQAEQIAELAERCAELANRALTTTTNQQTLAAMDRAAEPPQIAETTEHSRSFWQRLFKK